jgi:hypothetical protein
MQEKILSSFTHSFYLLPDDSSGRIAREFWWTSQEFSPAGFISPYFSILIYHLGMNNRPVGGRGSET